MIKDLAQKLQMLRIKHSYTQNQVAMKIGVSPSSISSYESGERTPSVDNLLALSHVYGCSTDFLLGKPNTEQGLFLNTKGLSDKQIEVLKTIIESFEAKNKKRRRFISSALADIAS